MKHILNIMATWRLMELIRDEDAPFDVLDTFRTQVRYIRDNPAENQLKRRFAKEIYEAINCDYCLSIWCGLFVVISTKQNLIFAFAYSAGALFISEWRDKQWESWIRRLGQ